MEGAFAPWHVVVILVIFTVLFGARRLPESARSLGQALRIFKAETRALHALDAAGPLSPDETTQPSQPA